MDMFTDEHDDIRKRYNTLNEANHWVSTLADSKLPANLISWIENLRYFFLATSNKNGVTNVNFKGTNSSKLLKVIDENTLLFPNYKGNGIFHGLGDIMSNPNVGLLLIDFTSDFRVKINATAKIIEDKNIIEKYYDEFDTFDIEMLIELKINYLIPNCSKQINVVRDDILSKLQ